jgi:hypothetical protein
MASDFLLAELERIVQRRRVKPLSAAHQYLMDDLMGDEGDNTTMKWTSYLVEEALK